ncbi:MAG: 50S ribosomal protein L32e [Acidilobaceae archaeon]
MSLEDIKQRRRIQRLIRGRRKPKFMRYLSWEFWKFERRDSWRKPKGKDSKMRLEIKGYPPRVKVGYRTRKEIRGLHPSGLKPVVIHSLRDLETLNPREHIVYIASSVGLRKRLELIKIAEDRGFKVIG